MKTLVLTMLFALSLGLSSVAIAQDAEDAAAERAEAARRAYMDANKALSAGTGGPEQVYIWSLRWLDARCAAQPGETSSALTEHRDRMESLRDKTRELIDAGVVPSGARHALDYYLAEAEVWVARGERG